MKNKNIILVIGGAGYIGQFLVKALVAKSYKVRILDRDTLKKFKDIPKGVQVVNGDVKSFKITKSAMKDVNICIHLAAKLGGINYLNSYPATILSENNSINSAVFEAAAICKINRLIYISSGMVFEKNNKTILSEDDLLSTVIPQKAYSFSKLTGEFYCKAYNLERGLNYSIVRLFNVYGPYKGDFINAIGGGHIIPELIDRILKGESPLQLKDGGNQKRAFTYIDDAVDGILTVMKSKKSINNDFNISSSESTEIKDLAKMIWNMCCPEVEFKVTRGRLPHQNRDKRLPSVFKARKILKWSAKISLIKGITKTIEARKLKSGN